MSNKYTRGIRLHLDLEHDFRPDFVRTIFDVGANEGQTLKHYAREFPMARIHCFEPVRAPFTELCANISRWDLADRVYAYHCALSDREGVSNISIPKDSRLSSMSFERPSDRIELITTTRLDSICERLGIKHINLLKIDTEGHELKVLEGARKVFSENRITLVQVEVSPQRNRYFTAFEDIAAWLDGDENFGFELYGIYDQTQHFTDRKSLLFFNAVFINCQYLTAPDWTNEMPAGRI